MRGLKPPPTSESQAKLEKYILQGAKQAAEKRIDLIRTPEKRSAGPKGHVDFAAFTARLKPHPIDEDLSMGTPVKSFPDTKWSFRILSTSFSAACKARHRFLALAAQLKPRRKKKRLLA
jgi:hypothetical protein